MKTYSDADRLDLHVINTYRSAPDVRAARTALLSDVGDLVERFVPETVRPLIAGDEIRAVRNVVDYFFEPPLVASMHAHQARDYLMSVGNAFDFDAGDLKLNGEGRPLILNGVHHHCIFSMIYLALNALSRQQRYTDVILLHQREPLDPRLLVVEDCVKRFLGFDVSFIQLATGWQRRLRRTVKSSSIVICLDDLMPQPGAGAGHWDGCDAIELMCADGTSLRLPTPPLARRLVRFLSAELAVLDIPSDGLSDGAPGGKLVLTTGAAERAKRCPVAEWVFWPAIGQWIVADEGGRPVESA